MSDSKLEKLNKLIGAWEISGDATGIVKYEKAEGGFFLTQQVDLEYNGRKISGLTMRTPDLGYAARFLSVFVALSFFRFDGESTLPPQADNASR
jgi:hypothetical protein